MLLCLPNVYIFNNHENVYSRIRLKIVSSPNPFFKEDSKDIATKILLR